jgi:hypothetical protein
MNEHVHFSARIKYMRVVVYHCEHMQTVLIISHERRLGQWLRFDWPGVSADPDDFGVRGDGWEMKCSEVNCWRVNQVCKLIQPNRPGAEGRGNKAGCGIQNCELKSRMEEQ